ncbi:cytochrome b2 [Rhypophila decipiens]|uniref:Cytochrome b2 n=1 Tax=Rhypophila decipiens TaxID=261697 RepID=A0AAN7BDL4_9PEZI|nr:cytochrome b2 [Rhypophila decipiens]
MTLWLAKRKPDPSPALQLACRAQHFRRWEIPRSSYPMTRPGYLTWRAKLKSQAATQLSELLTSSEIQPPLSQEEIDRIAALVRKEDLKNDEEAQILEDVACLVFLDDQFDDFEKKSEMDDEKIINILKKTWAKMSPAGHALALQMDMSDRAKLLIQKALGTRNTHQSTTSPPQPPPLESLISTHDFVTVAATFFPPKTYAFVSSAATDGITHRRNSSTYSDITLRPRVLRDVSSISLATTILGQAVSSPIYASPTSLGKTVHPEGEKEIGRACKELGIAQVISTSASFTVSEILDAINSHQQSSFSNHPVFFQLYVDRETHKSEALLSTAFCPPPPGGGGGHAPLPVLFLTVDSPVVGKREADERVPHNPTTTTTINPPMTNSPPTPDTKGSSLGRTTASFLSPSLTWKQTIPWLRSILPKETKLVLKGIQSASDAFLASETPGINGIVLSNHGGRNLDTTPPSIQVLLEIHKFYPQVFDKIDVLIDGGIMRGTDIFKALCLGAKGVGIGRGILWGLGSGYGREGVKRYVGILNDELEITMALCGVTNVGACRAGYVNTSVVDHLLPNSGHP